MTVFSDRSSALELIDSHVHLDASAFDADRPAVLARARQSRIVACMVPATHRAGWDALERLCRDATAPALHPAFGLHPMFLSRHAEDDLDALERVLERGTAVAVGECGLDFHVRDLDPERQRHFFRRQLDIAHTAGLPVIVHARRAEEEVLHTVRRYKGLRGVIHSFAGSREQARQLHDLGFLIGLGGPVTHPGSHRLHRLVADMPLEQLLLETDAPDQPGAGHRGERNEPAHLTEVLDCIAALRDEPAETIARTTTANARRLFGLADD